MMTIIIFDDADDGIRLSVLCPSIATRMGIVVMIVVLFIIVCFKKSFAKLHKTAKKILENSQKAVSEGASL